MSRQYLLAFSLIVFCPVSRMFAQGTLHINPEGYYESRGVNVMLFDDFYPEGHQGGLTIVQAGCRIAANGDVRLEPTPGQWSPVPRVGSRIVDRSAGRISVELWYPDSSKDKKGFNPINYPDVRFRYHITTLCAGDSIRLIVDLDRPLPREWAGRVGFNLELFPGTYFGEHYCMDGSAGLFPRQANGPTIRESDSTLQPVPLAVGRDLVLAPGSLEKKVWIRSEREDLQLLDGRGLHNNGWFVLRSTIPAGAAAEAVVWTIKPTENPDWMYKPVIQVSQVGYHPRQPKFAVIELDRSAAAFGPIRLERITQDSSVMVKEARTPKPWGNFLRYRYLRFDFSDITEEGLYKIQYGGVTSNEFVINKSVFSRDVWQPSLEYFLPVQMCHMEVRDRYKVWHGYCHMDDARMAPLNHNHFDGYYQHGSTLTSFAPGEHVPGLNEGG